MDDYFDGVVRRACLLASQLFFDYAANEKIHLTTAVRCLLQMNPHHSDSVHSCLRYLQCRWVQYSNELLVLSKNKRDNLNFLLKSVVSFRIGGLFPKYESMKQGGEGSKNQSDREFAELDSNRQMNLFEVIETGRRDLCAFPYVSFGHQGTMTLFEVNLQIFPQAENCI